MAFKDPNDLAEYRDPAWEEGSVMYFRRFQNRHDRDKMVGLIQVQRETIDPEKIRAARAEGKSLTTVIERTTLMSSAMALIVTMGEGWDGPEFVVPDFWKTFNGKPHGLRGQVAPFTQEWIGYREAEELDRVVDFLNDLYETKSEEKRRQFPDAATRASRSKNGRGDKE